MFPQIAHYIANGIGSVKDTYFLDRKMVWWFSEMIRYTNARLFYEGWD